MTESNQCLRFSIDSELCVGHGRCYSLAPQWFDTDDIGYGQVKDVLIGEGERHAAEEVAAACPEGAVSLVPAE